MTARLGYIETDGRGASDLVLAEAARRLAGRRVAGVVQVNTDRPDCARCDMDVIVLPGGGAPGPVIRISQFLGPEGRGCRLDPAGLEAAVAEVAVRLPGAEALILNKFGKHEAEGRGFRPLIAEALGQGVPVLLAVNGLNRAAFLQFAAGMEERLPPDPEALARWLLPEG